MYYEYINTNDDVPLVYFKSYLVALNLTYIRQNRI
jgi:hypothetical protein